MKGTWYSHTRSHWIQYFGFNQFKDPAQCAEYVKALLYKNAYTIDLAEVKRCASRSITSENQVLPRGNYFTPKQVFFVPFLVQFFVKSSDTRKVDQFIKKISLPLLAFVATLAHNTILQWISGKETSGTGTGFGSRERARRKFLSIAITMLPY